MALLQYKCPNCAGAIAFDANSQRLACPYCDTKLEVSALQAQDAGLDKDQAPEAIDPQFSSAQYSPEEQLGLRSYVCTSCAGEIVTDTTTGATICPFCGNPVVMASQFSGTVKPDLVVPFQLDRQAALAKLKEHYKGKKLLPKVFSDENHLEEIKGVYVPFWLVDTDIWGRYHFNTTKVRSWSDSRYHYTETSYFDVMREGTIYFRAVPADGSSKMDDTLMESLEPYNASAAVPFQTGYLSGYLAHKYDVPAEAVLPRIDKRMEATKVKAVERTVSGYGSVSLASATQRIPYRAVVYALYPVWLLNTAWKGRRFVFAMNGQTGKFIGDLPVDWGAFWRWVLILFVAIAGGGSLAVTLWWVLG
ncbi:MAG: hypothetical protein LBE83_03240 [Propionibacteriaceae bacterium]|jgi:DNA-directed RNA polymerase subunit RPC12/RpoP|nr:hypothetical protein [Propionibacteriaceae bacterium]